MRALAVRVAFVHVIGWCRVRCAHSRTGPFPQELRWRSAARIRVIRLRKSKVSEAEGEPRVEPSVGQNNEVVQPDVIVPPALYLPIIDNPDSEGQMAVVRALEDGRMGLLAYTALDRLADKCGANQPWMLLMTSELGRIRAAQPFDVVAFDLMVPLSQRTDGRLA